MTTEDDRLLTAKEVAAITGFQEKTIKIKARQGKIPYVQFEKQGRLMFLKRDVDAWIDKNRVEAGDTPSVGV